MRLSMPFPAYSANFLVTNTRNILKRGGICLQFSKKIHFKRVIPLGKNISLTQMEVKVENDGTKAVVTIPGFNLHDFDRTGHINIRSLQSMLTAARFLAYHTKDEQTGCAFLEYDKLTEDKFTFMASTKVTVNKRLYELSRREELKRKQSLAVSLSLGYTGTSSLNSVARLYCPDTEDTYVDNINQVVAVSKTTRKPVPLDDWWKQKYQTYSVGTQPLVIPLIDIPSKTHVYEVKVPWTDIDNYKHTNYVNYIRYCQDAALDATFAEFYSKVKGDFLGYLIKEMLISYKGESVANDILEVKTWENVENPFILHFSIQKDGRTIFQNTIKLYE